MRLRMYGYIGVAVMASSAALAQAQTISMQEVGAQFGRYDINEDAVLSGTEVLACNCAGSDLNDDKEISLAEFTAGLIIAGGSNAGGTAQQSEVPSTPQRERSAAVPSTAQQARTGPQPPVGKYGCHFTRFGSIIPSGDMISILSPGTYRFYDRGSGQFTVAAEGALDWTSGPLADSQIEGTYYRRSSDGKPTIKLLVKGIGKDHLGRSYDQTNYCIHHG